METVLLLAKTPDEAHQCVSYLCTDIQNTEEANHKLYFRRIMFGAFHICQGETDEETGEKRLTGDREIVIFPAVYEEQLENLKGGKTLVLCKNAMCVVGEGETKVLRRSNLISWVLGDKKFDYSVFGMDGLDNSSEEESSTS